MNNQNHSFERTGWRAAALVLLSVFILVLSSAGPSGAVAKTQHASAKSTGQPMPVGIPGKWNLILNSQFTGRTLDTSVWRPGWFGTGVTRAISTLENACYNSSNVTLPGDGTLHLNVTATPIRCKGVRQPYAASVITTNPEDGRRGGGFTYRYGVLEAKVYVPGSGSRIYNWPSLVTLGQVWPKDGEDDVLEVLGGTACFHFHSPGYAPSGRLGGCDPGFTAGWHTVSSDWQPGSVTYYFDGVEVGKITKGVTSAPMYLVVVNTVHRSDPANTRADSMQVAYVRVWQAPSPAKSKARA